MLVFREIYRKYWILLKINSAKVTLLLICKNVPNKYSLERHRTHTFRSCFKSSCMLRQLNTVNFGWRELIKMTPSGRWRFHSGRMHSGRIHSGRLHSGRLHSGGIHSGRLHSGRIHSGRLHSGRIDSGRLHSGRIHSGRLHSGEYTEGDFPVWPVLMQVSAPKRTRFVLGAQFV